MDIAPAEDREADDRDGDDRDGDDREAAVAELVGRLSNDVVAGLELSQRRGMIGGDLDAHIHHAAAFLLEWPGNSTPQTVVDLGSGGGLPGLVLADLWPDAEVRLSETRQKRADTLEQAVRKAGWRPRVQVWPGDVQDQTARHREWADVVTARLFASPALTAECAAPLLKPGGWLIVSEPPAGLDDSPDRWKHEHMETLGFTVDRRNRIPYRMASFQKTATTPGMYPRRRRTMERNPLW